MTALFGPQGANAVTEKPNSFRQQRYGNIQTWVKDSSAPGASDGTVLDAAFYNRIIGALDYIVGKAGVSALPGDDSALYRAVLRAVAGDASDALDTFKEIGDAIGNDPDYAATVLRLLSKRIQFDQAQILTSSEQLQAQQNMGLSTVASSGKYADLTGLPSLGSAASLDYGSSANNLVKLDTAGRYPPIDGSQITGVIATGGVGWSAVQGLSVDQQAVAQLNIGAFKFTGVLRESRNANAVTFAVKTPSGADPSPATPVAFRFPDGLGGYDVVRVTSALSITIPAGATLGTASGYAARVWIAAFNDAGTVRLGVRVCSTTSGAIGPDENSVQSSTVTPANAAHTFYTTGAAVTAKRWIWIGYASYESGLAAAGNWNVAPSTIALVEPSTPRPGQIIAVNAFISSDTASNITDTTARYSAMTLAHSLQSASNLIRCTAAVNVYVRAANQQGLVQMARGTTLLGPPDCGVFKQGVDDVLVSLAPSALDKPNTSATFAVGVSYRNLSAGGRVDYVFRNIQVDEIMG